MGDRSDHNLGFAKVTQKVMPNGEIRTHMRLPSGITTTITRMPDWKWQDGVPVHEGHYHKLHMENYIVLRGWMLYVRSVVPAGYDVSVAEKGEMVIFHRKEHHLVLLGPEAIIQTTTYGSSVGNSRLEDLDWWPSGEYYKVVTLNERSLFYARERKHNKELRR